MQPKEPLYMSWQAVKTCCFLLRNAFDVPNGGITTYCEGYYLRVYTWVIFHYVVFCCNRNFSPPLLLERVIYHNKFTHFYS